MASLTMKPALPSKKRKNSFGSEGQSSSSETATRIRSTEHNNNNTNETSSSRILAESRLPSKKRKGSHDSSLVPSSSSMNNETTRSSSRGGHRKGSNDLSVSFEDGLRPRGPSGDSGNSDALSKKFLRETPFLDAQQKDDQSNHHNEASAVPNVALEHLNALAETTEELPARRDRSNSITAAAAIIEPKSIAELKTTDVPINDEHSTSSTTTSGHRLLFEAIMMKEGDYDERNRLNSWGGKSSSKEESHRGRLDSLGHSFLDGIGRDRLDSMPPSFEEGITRERLDSLGGWRGARDRLESWGAMSDLSLPLGHDSSSGQVLPQPPFLESLGDDSKHGAVPNRISLERQRLSSIASMSEVSASNLPFLHLDAVADSAGDIQAYVAAAMASVSDQIADLAGVVETVANSADSISIDLIHRDHLDSDASSVASPLIIGASTDASRRKRAVRPRSWSTSSGLSLDFDAVVAAVNAAEAATGKLDLSFIGRTGSANSLSGRGASTARRTLPTQRSRGESVFTQTSEDISEDEKERIRERARAVAGYKPGSKGGVSKKKSGPIKKRSKRDSPEKDDGTRTPKHSNSRQQLDLPDDAPLPPNISSADLFDVPSSSSAAKSAKGQASQKWDSMFDCLLEFITDRKDEETAGMSQKDIDDWMWDGNVPTNFKTKCGKALGRWVNNQRSAKSKGTLKDDREERLIDAGLKWSVMAGNAWTEMLKELRVYVEDQTKDGGSWDGNVPTTYQIKTSEESAFAGEDKNLGRWVNRQRSLFQSGKLRKDRKAALDKLGLKWSMLATTTWDCMWETLREYVQEQEKAHGKWDGNVPANYKTNDNPPRALGRWINRQRSAYMKKKLKKECVEKLTNIGLKWSVHQRQGEGIDEDDNGDDCEFMDEVESNFNDEDNAADVREEKGAADEREEKGAADAQEEKGAADVKEDKGAANQEETVTADVQEKTAANQEEEKIAELVTSTTTATI